MIFRRYQLKKDAVAYVEGGHPWLFREQMSSAAQVFADGDWLRLVDGANRVIGHGMFEAEGAIAIRVLRRGEAPPDAAWVRHQLSVAVARRHALAARTDAVRLVHGESDGLAAVVVDRFADTLVVASYAAGVDGLARFVARLLVAAARGTIALGLPGGPGALGAIATPSGGDASMTQPIVVVRDADGRPDLDAGVTAPIPLPIPRGAAVPRPPTPLPIPGDQIGAVIGAATHVILRPARRRQGVAPVPRSLYGAAPDAVEIHEDGRTLVVDLEGGQKTGTYLDLRALRRTIADSALAGARVLNLFAYTGTLGLAAERAGAASITQVDQSARALELAAAHHVDDPAKHRFVVADVFEWFPALPTTEQYELVIVDPPAMTSKAAQIPTTLAAYRKLYRAAAHHVAPHGAVVAACCTSRIDRGLFKRTVNEALGPEFVLERDLPPDPDHPVGFAQADYLKISLWRRR